MTYIIEDVKRLIPEATKVKTMLNCTYFNIGWKVFVATQPDGQILLNTRRQLEIAREALEGAKKMLDTSLNEGGMMPIELSELQRPLRKIDDALDAINKEGEMNG